MDRFCNDQIHGNRTFPGNGGYEQIKKIKDSL